MKYEEALALRQKIAQMKVEIEKLFDDLMKTVGFGEE
jgi:hypothetical protein